MTNPLLIQGDFPRFDEISATHVVPAITEILASNRDALDRIKGLPEASMTVDLLLELEALDARLNDAWNPVEHLNAVVNSEALREAYNEARKLITDYQTELGQDEALFGVYRHLQAKGRDLGLTQDQRKSVENAVREFELSGVGLAGQDRERYAALKSQLSEQTSRFSENVLDATDHWKRVIEDGEMLAGLPESALQMLFEAAEREGLQGYLLTLDAPSYLAVMKFCENREVRREVYEAFVTRASDVGPDAGRFDNSELMAQIVEGREKVAALLGFAHFSEYSLATKMAESPDAVLTFLRDLAQVSLPTARDEMRSLEAFAKAHLGLSELSAWDIPFASERQRQQTFDLSEDALKAYFPSDHVINGMFDIVSRVFGVSIAPCGDIATWHPDVTTYQVKRDGETIAFFYMDLYARPKKRGGAWMADCRNRRLTPEGVLQRPVAFLTCNFSPGVAGKPSLLSHDEVVTLFHEFGHGLHHMLTKVECSGVSGINGVAWDAVELPSQFLENWCWDREAIALISRHVKTHEPLPDAQLDRLLAAKNYQAGMHMVRQLEFALFDFRLHHEGCGEGSIQALLDDVRQEVAVVPAPSFNRFQHGFNHIFSDFVGYAAGYYSYKWAEVLSADAFSAFKATSAFDRQVGERFLESILEKGGSDDAMNLFEAFMGRPPKIDALLEQEGIQRA